MDGLRRSFITAALVLALAPVATRAQDNSTSGGEPDRTASAAASSAPEPSPSFPAKPARLVRVHRLIDEMGVMDQIKLASTLRYEGLERNILEFSDRLPKAQQLPFTISFAISYGIAENAERRRIIDDMAMYYVTRLSDAEIISASNFYASSLGYKLAHNPQALTAEEKGKIHNYINKNSDMVKISKVDAGYDQKMQSDQQALNNAFIADFGHFFCRDLANDKINVSFCPTSGPPKASP
jgi:hypothetical protein